MLKNAEKCSFKSQGFCGKNCMGIRERLVRRRPEYPAGNHQNYMVLYFLKFSACSKISLNTSSLVTGG
jgi:hypothetical protein